jgi:regulator of sigma E protease
MNVLISILAFLVAVAILIAVHEFGHFIVARMLGVKVLRYSIGFGRVIFSWRPRGETEYAISAIPLGGYVKLLDEREGEVPPEERHRAFNRQPIWRRAAILAAGPAFNFLFALVAYWIVYMAGIPGIKPVVGPVVPNTPAAVAGIHEKDTILAVNGSATPTWQSTNLALLSAVVDKRPLRLRLQSPDAGGERTVSLHYGDIKSLTRPGKLLSGLGLKPWEAPIDPVIDTVSPDSAAARAGLQPGDRILAVDGRGIKDWRDFVALITQSPGHRLMLAIERGQRRLQVPVVPESKMVDGKPAGHLGITAKIPAGYGRDMVAYQRYGPLAALGQAASRTGQIIALTAVVSYRMVVGQVSLANLSGPIDIAHYAGSWAQAGLVYFLYFLALVSVSLGFVNILPIPLLDGGQLLFLGVELVRRRPVSERAEAIAQRVGLSLILLLVGFAVFNDLSRLIHS